jgi:hypothetical protein
MNDALIELPVQAWDRCTDLVRQARRAQLRGWNLAASALTQDLECSIPTVLVDVTALHQRLTGGGRQHSFVTASDVYRDLVMLGEEFEQLEYEGKAHQLSVTTESILLEGVYLGRLRSSCNGPV